MTRTYWLSCHVGYACRHSGACCSAGWPIPVESPRAARIREAGAAGAMRLTDPWIARVEGAPRGIDGVLAMDERGQCVFRRHQRCEIHRVAGHAAVPAACQHFPRICLLDDRGVHVTLSHYCPTAAAMLFEHEGPVRIVEGPPALPDGAEPEGLDARGALPPMRTPSRLFSLEEYSALEAWMVEVLTTRAPGDALHALRVEAGDGVERRDARALHERVRQSVPAPWSWPEAPGTVAPLPPAFDAVVGRYLAARAFASWSAYRSERLQAVTGGVEAAHAVLTVEAARLAREAGRPVDERLLREAVRKSDLLLVHYADEWASPP